MNRVPGDSDSTAATVDGTVGRKVWCWLLAGGLLLTLVYVLMPYGQLASSIYVLTSALAAVAIGVAVKRRPQLFSPTAWLLIACAVGLAACGHFIWYWLDLRGAEPFPSLADAFYLAVYPLFVTALWMLGRRDGRRDGGAFSDALIVGVAAVIPGWAFLIAPYQNDPSLSAVQLLVSTAYPVADLILLPLILRLIFLHRAKVTAHLLLLLGMLSYLAADMLYAHGNSMGWYEPGGITDGLWLVAYASIVAAIWHPSASVDPRGGVSIAELSGRRIFVLAAASLLAPAVILLTAGVDTQVVRVAAVGSVFLILLVMHRMQGLMKETHRQADTLEELAQKDPLTGAANRRHLDNELAREIARSNRMGSPFALAYLDLDYFKRFNDTRGHAAGDELLVQLVGQWRAILRNSDMLARIGGEEFVVLLPNTDAEQAKNIVERLRATVPLKQTCSAGIAQLKPNDTDAALMARADAAMYSAKRGGRNRVELAGD